MPPTDSNQPISNPFIRREFLEALDKSGSTTADTGWEPMHIQLDQDDGELYMPMYLKHHSMGEYVFDYAWADAYHRHGLNYYPKLVTAIPFTPSTGPRVAYSGHLQSQHCEKLFEAVLEQAERTQASSWHLLFPDQQQLALFEDPRLLQRRGVQYHWFNRGYSEFADFTGAMTSRKRKMIRKEREAVAAQGIETEVQVGSEIKPEVWQLFYYLYQRTYAKRNGTRGYLTETFFHRIAKSMPEQIAMAVAYQNARPIACALYFFDRETLYGRYWGSVDEYQFLHFELCYYCGIEFALSRGLQRYDAGAQGEHKIVRGFEPVITSSLHWIRHPEFRQAIAEFLKEENSMVNTHQEQATQLLPYRKGFI